MPFTDQRQILLATWHLCCYLSAAGSSCTQSHQSSTESRHIKSMVKIQVSSIEPELKPDVEGQNKNQAVELIAHLIQSLERPVGDDDVPQAISQSLELPVDGVPHDLAEIIYNISKPNNQKFDKEILFN
ncbi:hypothetical protein ABPG73_022905 [Tetrahymena malaccensis]